MENLIALTDSYKFSHFNQYPPKTQQIYSYMESRGGDYDDIVMFGLQYYLTELICSYHSTEEIRTIVQMHGLSFNIEGWTLLAIKHKGFLPIEIHAVPEGSINKPGDVLLTITNTDDEFPWLVGHLETLLMKLWYPITVASKSYAVKKMLIKHYDATSDTTPDYQYHNFGCRGSSSVESSAIGGMAHLTQFKGTDNFNCLSFAEFYYGEPCAGFSLPATEHSTVTSWGRENEFAFYEHYLETYKGSKMIACVMDSYNIYEAVDFITTGDRITRIQSEDYPTFIIRPDSGNPLEVLDLLLLIMEKNKVAYTTNSKGFKIFNKYRIIWGDGITPDTIDKILNMVIGLGYAADNIAFGSGGDLMQNLTRDTCKFAIKCSAAKVDGVWRDVYKEPITDLGKKSKRGLVTNPNLQLVYRNGELFNTTTFAEIRERSNAK